ncbi:hypothetical protein EJB05_19954, partial [Eragrostis curvula]
MRSGSGRVGSGGGGGGNGKNSKKMLPPPPAGVHQRYVPKRGAVLKRIVRGMLHCFLLISPPIVSSGSGRRVSPAPAAAGAGGGGAEQGK